MNSVIKTLTGSLREFKKDAIKTPIIVAGEALMECVIPFAIARFINKIQQGTITHQDLWFYGFYYLL